MKFTLGQAKQAISWKAIGLSTGTGCDESWKLLLNEAQWRIVNGPEKWWGIIQRYRIHVVDGLVTWPRHVAAVEGIAVNGNPLPIRNQWFEFLDSGYGIRDETTGADAQYFDRGTAATFTPFERLDSRVKIYSMSPELANTRMCFLGYDQENKWIRTIDGANGEVDGEWVTLSTNGGSFVTTFNHFSTITGVIKPVTVGPIHVYEVYTFSSFQRLIAIYEADEINPEYRRGYVGHICGCECSTQIDAIVKLDFIKAANDNDFLMIGNLPALKEMMLAVQKADRDDLQAATVHENRAWALLEREAQHYTGHAPKVAIKMEHHTWGAGSVEEVH